MKPVTPHRLLWAMWPRLLQIARPVASFSWLKGSELAIARFDDAKKSEECKKARQLEFDHHVIVEPLEEVFLKSLVFLCFFLFLVLVFLLVLLARGIQRRRGISLLFEQKEVSEDIIARAPEAGLLRLMLRIQDLEKSLWEEIGPEKNRRSEPCTGAP